MNVFKRLSLGLIFCMGIFSACQKETVDNSELLKIQQQNEDLRELILEMQTRTDSISNALQASQQQQANMKIALDSVNKKLDSLLAKIEKLNQALILANTDIASLKQQLLLLTQQYQQLLEMLNGLENKSCTTNSGLLAWYPFSGNVLDSSGNRYDGTIVNSVPFTTDHNNQPNSAIYLNGINGNFITTPVPFDFQREDAFSISFWFTDAGNTGNGRLLSNENPEGNFRIGSFRHGIYALSYGEYYVYDTVALNTWNHIVYAYSNRTIRVYKNGQLKVTTPDPGISPFTFTRNFTIGAKASSINDTWYGKLDELRIYNRVLTDAEVKRLYSN